MNFQKLQTVQDADFYLGVAFRNAKKRIAILQQKKMRRRYPEAVLKHNKHLETQRIRLVTKFLTAQLDGIHRKFPKLDELPDFYNELARITINYDNTKKSLAAIKWAAFQCKNQQTNTLHDIKKATSLLQLKEIRRKFYGRVASLVKQVKSAFPQIEKTRRDMKAWPDVKTEIHTVAIAGYPNVGKSSILKTLTGTKPEIRAYAFTTKRLNIGYFDVEPRSYQVIDTPGTFDRDMEKMNNIEKQAFLVLQHLAEKIVYVFDPSESCGYSLEKQIKLLKRIEEKFNQHKIIVCNKTDLEHIEENIKKVKHVYPNVILTAVTQEKTIDVLKKKIVKKLAKKKEE
jgi:nucleolar GTP-binding protein